MNLAAVSAALALAGAATPAVGQGGPLASTLATGPLSWEGVAEVYPPGRTLKIGVRTSIDPIGNVVSESWPIELGEAKGLRRMTLKDGHGTTEHDGKTEPMPESMYIEESEQFEIYRQLQVAGDRARELAPLGVDTFSLWLHPRTWFQIDRDGNIVGAVNEVNAAEGRAYQTFRFGAFVKSGEFIFPKHMEMSRDGKPFFTLDVTRFQGGVAH